MAKAGMSRKIRSAAEIAYRQQCSDERWEKRADYLMEVFSKPAFAVPRQMAEAKRPK